MRGAGEKIRSRAARDLRSLLRDRVSFRLEDRICYSFDATDLHFVPDAVAWPDDLEHVVGIARSSAKHGFPVVPRGAGTGYTGGSVPLEGGLAVSLERMDRILAVDARRRLAVVEPGVVNEDLRTEVQALGLTYPPDPASLKVSTIGGNVAESAGGPRTVLHGTTRDYVVGLEMVLADGRVVRTGILAAPRCGWDCGPLFVGSEGTLAVFTKVAVRLTERPVRFATLWAEFPSLSRAASAVAALTAAGLPLSVLEILDGQTYACAHEYVRGRPPEEASEGALLIELEGMGDDVERGIAAVSVLVRENGARGLRRATDESERDEIWEIRRSISPALARLGEIKINEDIAVPRSAIPQFVRIMHEVSRDVRLPILAFGHAGDGNLHVNIMLEKAGADELARARSAVARLFSAALSMGGALSGEHGIGITKAEHLAGELSPAAMDVTKRLKRALDPRDLINPGKVVTSAPNPWWIPRRAAGEGGVTC